MKDAKRRFELYAFWDHTGLEAHMARMAEKGWLIDKIDNFGWVYRRIPPQKLTFCVCYYPKASDFAPRPDEKQETFYAFCQYAGWKLAASWAQLQIFYNEKENPVPIETDPALELESIHRTVKRSTLFSHGIFALLAVFQAGIIISQFRQDPIRILSNTSYLFSSICWVLVLLLAAAEFIGYFRWRAKAKKAAERGEFLATKSRIKLQAVCLLVLAVTLLCYFLSVFSSGNRMLMAITPLMFLGMGLLILLINLLKRGLKRLNVSAWANRALTLAASFVLSFALVGSVTFGMLRAQRNGWFDRDEDAFPLTAADLLGVEYMDAYTSERWDSVSPLLARHEVRQTARTDPEHFNLPQLSYAIHQINIPALYNFCKNALLTEYEGGAYWQGRSYVPQDADPWGAAEVYRLYDEEYGLCNRYLLCWPGRIVGLDLGWEPTEEQMTVIGEKLGVLGGSWAGPRRVLGGS